MEDIVPGEILDRESVISNFQVIHSLHHPDGVKTKLTQYNVIVIVLCNVMYGHANKPLKCI